MKSYSVQNSQESKSDKVMDIVGISILVILALSTMAAYTYITFFIK